MITVFKIEIDVLSISPFVNLIVFEKQFKMRLINKIFFSPNYIFIKDNSELTDVQLLQKLGLNNCESITDVNDKKFDEYDKRHLYMTGDEKWTHLMDDEFYTLWHLKELIPRIKDLSKEFDVFCCSVGDIDYSFDFVFYQSGIIKREYVVEDPKINGGSVTKNNGDAFEIEPFALSKKDPLEKVMTIAQGLDINVQLNCETLRCYEVFTEKLKLFDFQDEY